MPQSPELAGGAGFTFEDAVSATYLVALLQEGYAPGIENRTVSRVALQQRDFGEPLDDLIVDFRSSGGEIARLSLQVKRALTISRAKNNSDFRDVIRDSWNTLGKPDFRKGIDRFGVAVGQIASQKSRDLRFLCEIARSSIELSDFEARFERAGNANNGISEIRTDIGALIEETLGAAISSQFAHEFFSHFVLIEFDFLHEGGTTEPSVLNQIRTCLASGYESEAPSAWANLRQLARNEAGRSGVINRLHLVSALAPKLHLAAAPSWQNDMRKLKHLTESWLADIEDNVGGAYINRASLLQELQLKLSSSRVVQIRGLPGSGKSVLLRRSVETELKKGPVLFLKSGRLEGVSWQSFALANGLSGGPLVEFLCEVAATGSNTLYIDGIDRIEKPHQPIIRDVVSAILTSSTLENWRIVVSLRDTGIEPLRNWMGGLLTPVGLGTVEVKSLSDDEASELVAARPNLSPLLFGLPAVREIVRRPFFAKILEQSISSDGDTAAFQPQSEVDLIENWWSRGGFNADGQAAVDRQRAIIELGALRARHLEQEIAIRDLSRPTVALLEQFLSDGLLQDVRQGHVIRFAHDIFFEWAFYSKLVDSGADWLDEIRLCGEPPAVARVVELLSQAETSQVATWSTTLLRIEGSGMRSQWTRAWLLAPLSLPNFSVFETAFADVVQRDNWRLLKKALVWFQAEKTTPNPNVLAVDLPQDKRIQIADQLSWPSDFAAWRRFINFIVVRAADIPVSVLPDATAVFEVWQNAFSGFRSKVSDVILENSAIWLREIEQASDRERSKSASRWDVLGSDLDEFRKSLSSMILRSAVARPDLAKIYLQQVIGSDRILRERYSEIVAFSPILARSHASTLVDLALKHLQEELPDARERRRHEDLRNYAERRRELLDKPDGELTEAQRRFLEFSGPPHISSSISHHDWETLSIDRGGANYFPPSPLREPFRSMFSEAPDQALRLLTDLSNHAMAAWRQLHRLSHENRGTPIPLKVDFPWGTQHFWGGEREYLWFRGAWAPQPLACAFLALENWVLTELQRGSAIDDLIKRIIAGNECIAVLGVAITAALQAQARSDVVFPLVTSQRLLSADFVRFRHDHFDSGASLIGFRGEIDRDHYEAVRSANLLEVRKRRLSDLLALYFLSAGGNFSERTKIAVENFKVDPPFETEEEKNNPVTCKAYLEDARKLEELVQSQNYRTEELPDDKERMAIIHLSPSASTPEQQQKVELARQRVAEGSLLAWAERYFETGQVGVGFTPATATDFAKKLEAEGLYKASSDEIPHETRRGAVAATAALLLRKREGVTEPDLEWARQVLRRIICVPEFAGEYWVPESIIPWHHAIFAARGLSADLQLGTEQRGTAERLLALVAHPLEAVSLFAVDQALLVWDVAPRLGWAALVQAFSNCHEPRHTNFESGEALYTPRERKVLLISAARQLRQVDAWRDIPLPPPAWVKITKRTDSPQFLDDDPIVDGELVDPREAWAEPKVYWRSRYASKALSLIPIDKVLAGEAGPEFIRFISAMLNWTIQKVSPPWVKRGARDRSAAHLYEWTSQFGKTLGAISSCVPVEHTRSELLQPILDLEGDQCWRLLRPFVEGFVVAHLSHAPNGKNEAVDILQLALRRMLQDPAFRSESYRAGTLYGMDLPHLADALMLLSVERTGEAAGKVSDQWAKIERALPVVDSFIRAAGWAGSVMTRYLSLCERFRDVYSAGEFADQVLCVIEARETSLKGWRGTALPARIAGLVQHFADREAPMARSLGQKFLRILDVLVDLGDRRSAALQLSEWFREVKADYQSMEHQ